MAKNIIVSLDGEESSFGFKAVDRASLYGKRRRIALDKDGNPCTRGSLLEDGSLLLKSGMSGQGYFLDARGIGVFQHVRVDEEGHGHLD